MISRGMEAISHRKSLFGLEGRNVFVRDKGLAHTYTLVSKMYKLSAHQDFNSKKEFKQIEVAAKLLEHFT